MMFSLLRNGDCFRSMNNLRSFTFFSYDLVAIFRVIAIILFFNFHIRSFVMIFFIDTIFHHSLWVNTLLLLRIFNLSLPFFSRLRNLLSEFIFLLINLFLSLLELFNLIFINLDLMKNFIFIVVELSQRSLQFIFFGNKEIIMGR